MNALAVIFRLLSLFSLVGLATFVWVQWETEKAKKNAFLDEQVSNGYAILQSTKEAQWKDVGEKKSAFKEVFLDNQPVGLNDENPLEIALAGSAAYRRSCISKSISVCRSLIFSVRIRSFIRYRGTMCCASPRNSGREHSLAAAQMASRSGSFPPASASAPKIGAIAASLSPP